MIPPMLRSYLCISISAGARHTLAAALLQLDTHAAKSSIRRSNISLPNNQRHLALEVVD